jgi:predicted RNase H-like HicB family nuclease
MEEALELHLEMLREMGEEIPEPNSQAATVRVAS